MCLRTADTLALFLQVVRRKIQQQASTAICKTRWRLYHGLGFISVCGVGDLVPMFACFNESLHVSPIFLGKYKTIRGGLGLLRSTVD